MAVGIKEARQQRAAGQIHPSRPGPGEPQRFSQRTHLQDPAAPLHQRLGIGGLVPHHREDVAAAVNRGLRRRAGKGDVQAPAQPQPWRAQQQSRCGKRAWGATGEWQAHRSRAATWFQNGQGGSRKQP